MIAMDVKDADDFHDESGRFVEDDLAFALCAKDIFAYASEVDGEGEVKSEDPATKEEFDEWAGEMIMNYVFYRFTGPDIPASADEVVKLVRDCCFWPPQFIWCKGTFQESPSDEALNEDGEVVGIRFAL